MKIIKISNIIGLFLIHIAVLLIILSRKNEGYLDVGSIFLFIGIILIIPDYWVFYVEQKGRREEMDIYWFTKFLTLPLVLLLLVIYFFVRILL